MAHPTEPPRPAVERQTDQMAPSGAVSLGSLLFAFGILSPLFTKFHSDFVNYNKGTTRQSILFK